jgi:hypothetical protein
MEAVVAAQVPETPPGGGGGWAKTRVRAVVTAKSGYGVARLAEGTVKVARRYEVVIHWQPKRRTRCNRGSPISSRAARG